MSANLTITGYSDKSFVIRGNTRPYRSEFSAHGGKWNYSLRGGAGWIFSKKHLSKMQRYVTKMNSLPVPNVSLHKTVIPQAKKRKLVEKIEAEAEPEAEAEFDLNVSDFSEESDFSGVEGKEEDKKEGKEKNNLHDEIMTHLRESELIHRNNNRWIKVCALLNIISLALCLYNINKDRVDTFVFRFLENYFCL